MPLTRLATAAQERPDEPWLFYRPGLDWRWQSWARVADRVARALTVWSEAVSEEPPTPVAVPPNLRPEDAVPAILAACHLGSGVIWHDGPARSPLEGIRLWQGEQSLLLPPVRGALDVEPLQALDVQEEAEPAPQILPKIWRTDPPSGSRRPLLFVQPELVGAESGVDGLRRLQDLTALSLELDAGWVLEPQRDAFVPTVVWSRPTHLLLRRDGLARLLDVWGAGERRHSRLLQVVVAEPAGEAIPDGVESMADTFLADTFLADAARRLGLGAIERIN